MTDETQLVLSEKRKLNIKDVASGEDIYGTIQRPEQMFEQHKSTLKFFERIGFSLGHVFNDISAAVWFSYFLLYFQNVIEISGIQGSYLLLLGQVIDAIATPIVGYITDSFLTKQKFHFLGSVVTFITFPLIFIWFPEYWKTVYFSIVIVFFQIGWPLTQVGCYES